MNIPNALSLLRIFLVAPFLIAVIYKIYLLALILFVVAGVSDYLDGYLARRLEQKSVLGSFLDPMGDKLLIAVAFVALALQGSLPAWLAVIVVAKDVYTAMGAGILHFSGHFSVAIPSFWGKLSTLLQIVTIGMVLFATMVSTWPLLLSGLFMATGCVSVIACVQYILGGIQVFADNTRSAGHPSISNQRGDDA